MILPFMLRPHKRSEHGGHIHALALDGDRIAGQGILLYLSDIVVDAGGQGQDQGDADDADGPGKGGEHRASLFCHQVVQR